MNRQFDLLTEKDEKVGEKTAADQKRKTQTVAFLEDTSCGIDEEGQSVTNQSDLNHATPQDFLVIPTDLAVKDIDEDVS
jgi:hypothetical protein